MEIGRHGVNMVSVVRHVEVEHSPDHEAVRTQNHKARENHAVAYVKAADPVTHITVQVANSCHSMNNQILLPFRNSC